VIGGRYLTDGGIVRNLPVDVVRSLGADIIIAIDVGKPLAGHEALGSSLVVMDQATDIMIKDNVRRQMALLGERDVLIRPDLGTIGTEDFERGAEAAERGERAARHAADALSRYSVSERSMRHSLPAAPASGPDASRRHRERRRARARER